MATINLASPIIKTLVSKYFPHPILLRDVDTSPDRPEDRKMNIAFQRNVLSARKLVTTPKGSFATVVFGPNNFKDFPLQEMLREGPVYGFDVDMASMQSARESLDRRLQERLFPIQIDASLVANDMIETALAVMKKHPHLTRVMVEELSRVLSSMAPRNSLPIMPESFDLVSSISAVYSFLATAQNCATSLIFGTYGQDRAYAFLSQLIESPGQRRYLGQSISDAYLTLGRKAKIAQLYEIARILKPGGVVFLSDHSMQFITLNTSDHFPVNTRDILPFENTNQEVKLESRTPILQVEIGEEIKGVNVVGDDSWDNALQQVPSLTLIERHFAWSINRPGLGIPGYEGEYFLDTAMVLKKD